MSWFTDLFKRFARTRAFAWFGSRTAARIDRFLHRVTGGRVLTARLPAVPALMLTAVGRKTGRLHTTPLLYVRWGSRLVVAGTNWGQRREPDWALNLRDNPKAWVEIRKHRAGYRARIANEEEKGRVWPELDKMWPAYETYRDRSGRDIAVFVLEPVEEGALG